jgi:hypothetical protein
VKSLNIPGFKKRRCSKGNIYISGHSATFVRGPDVTFMQDIMKHNSVSKQFRKMQMNCGEWGGTTKCGEIIQINTLQIMTAIGTKMMIMAIRIKCASSVLNLLRLSNLTFRHVSALTSHL